MGAATPGLDGIPGRGDTTVLVAATALRCTLSELADDWKAETVSIGVCATG
jgi:hypothetical protein